MAPRKTLILHAGMGKTGSTAIQRAFWTNRAVLSRAGIAYPDIGATATAHHLISPFLLPHHRSLHGWQTLAPAEWVHRVAALPEPLVFMSSELIAAAGPAEIAAFCAAVSPVLDLRLLVYLRRQDDMIAAAYAQQVKGVRRSQLSSMIEYNPDLFDYARLLAPWETALGRDRMIVRPYERGQFHQGDLIRDVAFHALGLADLPAGFVHDPATTANARLPVAATEFKRLVNLLIPDRLRAQAFVAPLAACPPDPPGTHLLGRADRARLIAHYADSNAQVARTCMNRPAGDLFRDPLPADAPAAPPDVGPEALRAVADVLAREAPELLLDLAAAAAIPQDRPGTPAARAAARMQAALAPVLPQARLVVDLRRDLQAARAENARLVQEAQGRARSHAIAIAGHERRLVELRDKLQQLRVNEARLRIAATGGQTAFGRLRRRADRIWRGLTGRHTPHDRPRS